MGMSTARFIAVPRSVEHTTASHDHLHCWPGRPRREGAKIRVKQSDGVVVTAIGSVALAGNVEGDVLGRDGG